MDKSGYLGMGKIRGLDQIADADGVITMCAMDHRGSLQRMLNPASPDAVTYEQIVDFKRLMAETLALFPAPSSSIRSTARRSPSPGVRYRGAVGCS